MQFFTIAAVQNTWTAGNTRANVRKMIDSVEGVCSFKEVDMICFCELAVQGFDAKRWERLAEPIPGPSTKRLGKVARRVKKWIVMGSMEELEGQEIYNTCVLISPRGDVAFRYRKSLPWIPFEPSYPGNDYGVFEIENLAKLGFMICYDGFFPEVARSLVWNGAEIIVWPSMIYHPMGEIWRTLAKARAIENQCFVVGINGTGTHGGGSLAGHSLFVDPTGSILSEAGDSESVLVESLDLEMVRVVREKGTKIGNALLKHWKQLNKKYEIYTKPVSQAKF